MLAGRLHYDRIHEISDMIIMPGSFFTMSPDNLSLPAEDMLQSIIMYIARKCILIFFEIVRFYIYILIHVLPMDTQLVHCKFERMYVQ